MTARYHLDGLSRTETEEYIRHRLQVAGGEGKVRMTLAALNAVHELSGGIPRIINLVCDRSLLAGYVAATRTITADMVRRAAAEVQGERGAEALEAAAHGAPGIGHGARGRARRPPDPAPDAAGSDSAAGAHGTSTAVAVLPIPPPAPPFSERLETAVLESDRLGSFRYALARLEGLWDRPYLQRTGLRTSLEQVRRLDLPAVLEMFHPGRKDTCFLALVGLDGDTAVVTLGDGPPLKVPASQLDQLWTREAIFLWPDDGRLVADPRKAEAWTRDALERLGYARGPSLGLALEKFQRDSQLIADGVMGARTLMTLYSRGSDPRPRLKSGSSS